MRTPIWILVAALISACGADSTSDADPASLDQGVTDIGAFDAGQSDAEPDMEVTVDIPGFEWTSMRLPFAGRVVDLTWDGQALYTTGSRSYELRDGTFTELRYDNRPIEGRAVALLANNTLMIGNETSLYFSNDLDEGMKSYGYEGFVPILDLDATILGDGVLEATAEGLRVWFRTGFGHAVPEFSLELPVDTVAAAQWDDALLISEGQLMAFDGMTARALSVDPGPFNDVIVLASKVAFAVGDDGLLAWSIGEQWQSTVHPSGENFNAAAATRSTNAFVVGDNGTVLHRGGDSQWERLNTPMDADLNCIKLIDGVAWIGTDDGILWRYGPPE